jgi:hypothetical protein
MKDEILGLVLGPDRAVRQESKMGRRETVQERVSRDHRFDGITRRRGGARRLGRIGLRVHDINLS